MENIPKANYRECQKYDARTSDGIRNISLCRSRGNKNAVAVRKAYSTYFQGTGALSYQWEKALQNDF
ncbi:unnamed protein product [Lasius platythorax]|uniref:Uncharacterized protein n=1 Tax=Lasius platythorax TaxID=488582 RepID=A0AAV2N287_9HYME